MSSSAVRSPLNRLIGQSAAMAMVRREAGRVAPTPWPLLIVGETGTGKTALASAIHDASGRPGRFVVLNCAALAPTLVESQLFGYKAGAFTGADRDTPGLFEAANGGTLFLDEIGDLAGDVQARLLRVLEARRVRRIGESTEREIDVRIVGATHQPLPERIAAGRFREDLYYRIGSFVIELPPLRERAVDIPALAASFLSSEAADRPGGKAKLNAGAQALLSRHDWPGNLRELQSVLRQALVSAGESTTIEPRHLPALGEAGGVRRAPVSGEPPPDAPLSTLFASAIRGDASRRDRWARFLLAFAEEQGTHTLVRNDVLPLLRQIRGPEPTENSIVLEWTRKWRPALLGTGLVMAGTRRLDIDVPGCQQVVVPPGHPPPAAATGPAEAVDAPAARQIGTHGATPTPAAAIDPGTPATNLPPRSDALIGRDDVLEQLADTMTSGTELLTITGPGGIGKTALAAALGRRLLPDHPAGVWLADVRPASDPAGVAAAVAAALDLSLPADSDPVPAVGDALAAFPDPLVLILDNFEQVVECAHETIGTWLHRAPHVRMIVTSRQTLGLRGEHRYDLAPLPTPPPDASIGTVGDYDSVRLLLERGRRVHPDLELSAATAGDFAAICEGLSGIPLALELAAARLRTLSPRQLAERLGRKFELLRTGLTDRPEHHRTLEEALDWSVNMLAPSERMAFVGLSTFSGGFTLEAAEALLEPVAGDDDVLDLLDSLVDKSLVHVDIDATPEPRYDCYTVIRDFGRRLASDPALADTAARFGRLHTEWYAGLAASRWKAVSSGGPSSALSLALLAPETGNLGAAREWAAANGEHELAVNAALGAVVVAAAHGNAQQPLAWLAESVRHLSAEAEPMWVECVLLRASLTAQRTNTDWPSRTEDLARAVAIGRERCEASGDDGVAAGERRKWQARLSKALRLTVREYGEARSRTEGLDLAQEAMQLAEASGDDSQRVEAWVNLGNHYHRTGRHREAVAALGHAFEIAEPLGPSRLLGHALIVAGHTALMVDGDPDASIDRVTRAHHAFHAVGDRVNAAWTLIDLGSIELMSGRIESGIATLDKVRPSVRRLGSPRLQAWMAFAEVLIAHRTGNEERVLERTLPEHIELARGDGVIVNVLRMRRGDALRRLGRYEEALELLDAIPRERLFPRPRFLHATYHADTLTRLGSADEAAEAVAYARSLIPELNALVRAGDLDIDEALAMLDELEAAE